MNPLNRVMDMLKVKPLTEEEGERMRELLASGPCSPQPEDARLFALGLAQDYDGTGDSEATPMAFKFFYNPDGGVSAPFRWF